MKSDPATSLCTMDFQLIITLVGLYSVSQVTSQSIDGVRIPQRPNVGGIMGRWLMNPELKFAPDLPGPSTLIHLTRFEASHKKYLEIMEREQRKYMDQRNSTSPIVDCSLYNQYRPEEDWTLACDVTQQFLMNKEACGYDDFGFSDLQPCVMLSLDRLYNWLPMPYTNSTVPEEIKSIWHPYSIAVKCEGADPVSKDNVELSLFPEEGFHFKYFPQQDQAGWLSPVVFVQVLGTHGLVINITCSAWAANMLRSPLLNTGYVNFQVLVD